MEVNDLKAEENMLSTRNVQPGTHQLMLFFVAFLRKFDYGNTNLSDTCALYVDNSSLEPTGNAGKLHRRLYGETFLVDVERQVVRDFALTSHMCQPQALSRYRRRRAIAYARSESHLRISGAVKLSLSTRTICALCSLGPSLLSSFVTLTPAAKQHPLLNPIQVLLHISKQSRPA